MVALDYAVLAGYFLILIVIGVITSLQIKKQEDYFLGGDRSANCCKPLPRLERGPVPAIL
ncbi:MAG: hypothetical protein R3C12_24485 [Planctomycetaceae bacterium]